MPYTPKYISAQDLANAVSPSVLVEIYDDDNTGDLATVLASDVVLLVIERAEGQIDSRLLPEYNVGNLVATDRLIRHASLEYAIAYSYERHPEYVRSGQASDRLKRAEELMQRIQDAIQQLPDNPDDRPANVGGVLLDPTPIMFADPVTGAYTGGDF